MNAVVVLSERRLLVCRGTTAFLAPEMARARVSGPQDVSTASDVWAFGMVLFELATLQTPYFHLPPQYVEYCEALTHLPPFAL